MTNGNGVVTWKILASVFGGLLLALAAWAAKGAVGDIGLNSKGVVNLDKRMALVEQSNADLKAGQAEILREIRKALDE